MSVEDSTLHVAYTARILRLTISRKGIVKTCLAIQEMRLSHYRIRSIRSRADRYMLEDKLSFTRISFLQR